MPPVTPTSMATRKRTRSTNISENNNNHPLTASTNAIQSTTATAVSIPSLPTNTVPVNAPPKRQRNNPPSAGPPPPVPPRSSYSFRNRSLTPDPRHPSARFPSLNPLSSRSPTRQRYNLRPRRPQSQVRLPQVPTPNPTIPPRRIRRPIPPIVQSTTTSLSTNIIQSSSELSPSSPPLTLPPPVSVLPGIPPVTLPTPPVIHPRQYRLVYISDDDDITAATTQPTTTIINTTLNLVTDDEDDELVRPQGTRRRASRSTSGAGLNTR